MTEDGKCEVMATALGRIPSGVFILVVGDGNERRTGLLASWVQQAAFEPAQITVAVNKSRYILDWLTPGAPVTLNQVQKKDPQLFRHFGKGFEPDAEAFAGVDWEAGENGLPRLKAALTTLEGTVEKSLDSGDHRIVLITVSTAVVHHDPAETEPFVHLRRNGFSY